MTKRVPGKLCGGPLAGWEIQSLVTKGALDVTLGEAILGRYVPTGPDAAGVRRFEWVSSADPEFTRQHKGTDA